MAVLKLLGVLIAVQFDKICFRLAVPAEQPCVLERFDIGEVAQRL